MKEKINRLKVQFFVLFLMVFTNINKVHAVEKIEGGDVTIEGLGTIIKGLSSKLQIFGIILAFISTLIFVIQYIVGDDDTKQRKKKTIIYTLSGVAILILVPSLINFIIDTLN